MPRSSQWPSTVTLAVAVVLQPERVLLEDRARLVGEVGLVVVEVDVGQRPALAARSETEKSLARRAVGSPIGGCRGRRRRAAVGRAGPASRDGAVCLPGAVVTAGGRFLPPHAAGERGRREQKQQRDER